MKNRERIYLGLIGVFGVVFFLVIILTHQFSSGREIKEWQHRFPLLKISEEIENNIVVHMYRKIPVRGVRDSPHSVLVSLDNGAQKTLLFQHGIFGDLQERIVKGSV